MKKAQQSRASWADGTLASGPPRERVRVRRHLNNNRYRAAGQQEPGQGAAGPTVQTVSPRPNAASTAWMRPR